MKIIHLAAHHNRQDFDCGKPELNDFLKQRANQYERKDVGRTYVAVVSERDERILGYHTIAFSSVPFQNIPENLPHHPVPVLHLGRLARDLSARGQRAGETLLFHVLTLATQMSEIAGIHAVEVVALDAEAQSFYEHYDFKPLLENQGRIHLYLPMKKIRKLNLWKPASSETIEMPFATGKFKLPKDTKPQLRLM